MCCIRKKTTRKKKIQEFSKALLIQESCLVWITTLAFVALAYISVKEQFLGDLPWLTALVSALWVAYGVSQAFYYNKAKKENTKGGIKYMSVANKLGIIEHDNEVIDEINDEELEDQSCADG